MQRRKRQTPPRSFTAPQEFWERLERAARAVDRSRSSYIRRAVEKQIALDEKKSSVAAEARG